MPVRTAAALLPLILLTAVARGDSGPAAELSLEELHASGPPPAELLILGTFHFKDAGLDGYVPEVDVDILSPERQKQVREVVGRLARFRPTKIALEARGDRAEELQAEYARYRAGELELGSNEIHQLGFRLGRQLGHERLWFVDAEGRAYPEFTTEESWEEAMAACGPEEDGGWDERYTALYRHDDRAKAGRGLRETLLAVNDERRLLAGHGHYLLGIGRACGEKFPAADHLTGWWYNRNLRIFAKLRALTDVPEDRVLLVIGAGHVPILRHAARASPEYRLREVAEFLGE